MVAVYSSVSSKSLRWYIMLVALFGNVWTMEITVLIENLRPQASTIRSLIGCQALQPKVRTTPRVAPKPGTLTWCIPCMPIQQSYVLWLNVIEVDSQSFTYQDTQSLHPRPQTRYIHWTFSVSVAGYGGQQRRCPGRFAFGLCGSSGPFRTCPCRFSDHC